MTRLCLSTGSRPPCHGAGPEDHDGVTRPPVGRRPPARKPDGIEGHTRPSDKSWHRFGATKVAKLGDARTRPDPDHGIWHRLLVMANSLHSVAVDVDVVMSGPGSFFARPGKGHCGGPLRPEAS